MGQCSAMLLPAEAVDGEPIAEPYKVSDGRTPMFRQTEVVDLDEEDGLPAEVASD